MVKITCILSPHNLKALSFFSDFLLGFETKYFSRYSSKYLLKTDTVENPTDSFSRFDPSEYVFKKMEHGVVLSHIFSLSPSLSLPKNRLEMDAKPGNCEIAI
jgi:hypothetical protein